MTIFRFRKGFFSRPILQRQDGDEWHDVTDGIYPMTEFSAIHPSRLEELRARVAQYEKRAANSRKSRQKKEPRSIYLSRKTAEEE